MRPFIVRLYYKVCYSVQGFRFRLEECTEVFGDLKAGLPGEGGPVRAYFYKFVEKRLSTYLFVPLFDLLMDLRSLTRNASEDGGHGVFSKSDISVTLYTFVKTLLQPNPLGFLVWHSCVLSTFLFFSTTQSHNPNPLKRRTKVDFDTELLLVLGFLFLFVHFSRYFSSEDTLHKDFLFTVSNPATTTEIYDRVLYSIREFHWNRPLLWHTNLRIQRNVMNDYHYLS